MPRRPIDRPAKITGDTNTHAAYSVGPASDYALPRGAWVIAPFGMTLSAYRSVTGGWALNGGGAHFQHLIDGSRRTGWVAEGAPIAQIAGEYDDPGSMWGGEHLHAWIVIGGVRMSIEEWVASRGYSAVPYGSIASPTFTSGAGSGIEPFTPEEEEEEMTARDSAHWFKRSSDGASINVIFNTGSGYYEEFSSNDGGYNTAVVQSRGVLGNPQVSESHAAVVMRSCAEVRSAA